MVSDPKTARPLLCNTTQRCLPRSDRFKRNETELVILVTPYIVRPASGKPLAAPTDGLVPPNDVERLVVGSNYRQQAAPGVARPRGRDGLELIGPAGFVLE